MSWPEWLASVPAKAASVEADYAQAATVLQPQPGGSVAGGLSEAQVQQEAEVP
jgi:hypothetical protein